MSTTKNIVIVGGSGGLGYKVTEYLASIRKYQEEGLHDTYNRFKYNVTAVSSKDLDIRVAQHCRKYFSETHADIVINLAGRNYDKFIHKLDRYSEYDIEEMLSVNLYGAINILAGCLGPMRIRGYGRVIMASSVLATKNIVGTGLYSSCKAFIDRLVKIASAENISKGVTVNSIQLGYFDGGLTYKLADPEAAKCSIPLKRFGTIEELCNTIEYIINTEYLTGVNLALNGGVD